MGSQRDVLGKASHSYVLFSVEDQEKEDHADT